MSENKTKQYIKYAIGEIVLVMIGILLALQVNNWNEKRKLNSQLSSILETVKTDLEADTLMTSQIIKFYDTINKYSTKVMKNEITVKNLDSFPICKSLVSLYQPMTIQEKGFQQLKNFSITSEIKKDSLTTNITQFYTVFKSLIANNNDMIKTEVLENIDFFKKQDWFIPWMQGASNPEVTAYFGESQDYKNRVAANNIFATSNHQRMLKVYKDQAAELIALIEERLKTKD
jgi:IMP cyclohydrolase